MTARVAAACLLMVIAIAGCPRSETPMITEVPSEQPPAAAPAAPAAPETVVRVAWLSTMSGGLMLLDPETMEATATGVETAESGAVSWSKDGSIVATLGPDWRVRITDLRPDGGPAIGPEADTQMGGFAVSPDGTRVAVVQEDGVAVWAGGSTTQVAIPRACGIPAWSSDGRRLAIGAMGDDESVDGGLWLWDGQGDATQIVAPAEGWGCTSDVMWSPDGEMLAWSRGAEDGWSGDLARADGSDLRRDVLGAGPLAWLPDGSGLLVSVHIEAGAFGTGIYRLAGDTISPIGPIGDEDWDSRAVLSPDGSRVLAWGRPPLTLTVDVATGEAQPWDDELFVEGAAWAPDGRLALLTWRETMEAPPVWLQLYDGAGNAIGSISVEAAHDWCGRWIELPADAAVVQ